MVTEATWVVTLISNTLEVAGLPNAQLTMLDVNTQVTRSRSANVLLTKVLVAEGAPWEIPFTNHSYNGEPPPFVGVAVNVTDVPLQILMVVPAGAGTDVIVTETGNDGFTVIVIGLL